MTLICLFSFSLENGPSRRCDCAIVLFREAPYPGHQVKKRSFMGKCHQCVILFIQKLKLRKVASFHCCSYVELFFFFSIMDGEKLKNPYL
jgi:hypothetical protein